MKPEYLPIIMGGILLLIIGISIFIPKKKVKNPQLISMQDIKDNWEASNYDYPKYYDKYLKK